MSQVYCSTKNEKGKHLNYEKRIKIEALSKAGLKPEAIAKQIGCCRKTIVRELKRGKVTLLNSDLTERTEYSADVGQQKHEYACTNKGPKLKIGNNYELMREIERLIIDENMSVYAAREKIKASNKYNDLMSMKTIYNYIDEGIFPNLTNEHLPVKKDRKKRTYKKVRKAINNTKGRSISERDPEIELRREYGHWEMDTVVGKKGTSAVLLVLTERKTRQEIIIKLRRKTQDCVVKALDRLERKIGSKKFRKTFKRITCDNGCENLDYEGIERSVTTKQKRTTVYYAHPYSAWERGTNETANKLIRRFITKGTDIGKLTQETIEKIEDWINNYPRRIFGGLSSLQYRKCLGIL